MKIRNLKYKNSNKFTLLELVCVLTISLLVIGIVIGRVGKTPAFISLDNCVNRIQGVLSEASNQAVINGKKITILYSKGQFFPENNKYSSSSSFSKKYLTYTLPEKVEINFPKLEDNENISFIFFPDGSASAPEIHINYKKHSAIIKISKLTGIASISNS